MRIYAFFLLDYRSTVKQEISRSILQSLNAHWLPPHCRIVLQERRDFLPRYLNIPKSDLQEQAAGKSSNFRVGIFDQTTPATLLPSVIVRNDEDLWDVTSVFPSLLDPLSRDSLSARDDAVSEDKQLQNAESASEETEKVPSRDDILKPRSPLEVLEEDIENLRAKIEGSVGERQSVLEEIESGKSTIAEHEEKLLGLRKEKRVRERTNIVLENPEENVTKLEAMVANSREKLKKLELQWREHEAPLLEALSSAEKRTQGNL
uniref:Coiled-coil domain-containing protein 22 homolog n=1 Tax=Lutzomyia longipalpis TaxID=7200 RepID=A0A1B0CUT5_LUTLO